MDGPVDACTDERPDYPSFKSKLEADEMLRVVSSDHSFASSLKFLLHAPPGLA